ncbi:hypothetical protein ASG41_21265 [Modestobacter sp. Leaf380]|nr:hypothetical protein ASG41_21265 [Modestobacter sp. Leaf380]
MIPDAYTLTFLLVLAEFNSDDGHHSIMWMDEESAEYWEAPYAGACWPCKRVRDDAVYRGRPVPGMTVPEAHAIPYWRPVHDGADAVAFLREHSGCGETPPALRSSGSVGDAP